ncbi:DUF3108 domain-containing protein [Collimonas sp.]|jgi:hypothetical protein|uniref:DUF3108 domain-containing protein n=1 Tax=Collimonas sp. TaxID=1963772 RepID=UPI002CB5A65D|nr:DUF3108 domain-containing protein [Collimonas sp.]HWW06418.1 DUF3108 domain-containing protein [Collimonas sp.]
MTSPLLRLSMAAALCCSMLAASAASTDHPATKYKIDLPPSADLSYAIQAKQSGITLGGEGSVKWQVDDKHFSVASETRAMLFGKILESSSEGSIDSYGLAPVQFINKRFRKEATTTTFHRDSGSISFSESSESYPLKGGEQDRTSIIWQLISVARAVPKQFKPGSDWTFFVAGMRDAEAWTFKVINIEKIKTPMGDLDAVHIFKAPPPDAKDQQLDIWLAPSLEWYPVRLRFTEPNKDFVEQTLQQVSNKAGK